MKKVTIVLYRGRIQAVFSCEQDAADYVEVYENATGDTMMYYITKIVDEELEETE